MEFQQNKDLHFSQNLPFYKNKVVPEKQSRMHIRSPTFALFMGTFIEMEDRRLALMPKYASFRTPHFSKLQGIFVKSYILLAYRIRRKKVRLKASIFVQIGLLKVPNFSLNVSP